MAQIEENYRYSYKSKMGTVWLVPRDGRYVVIYNNEELGSYATAAGAADDVSGGHTFLPSNGVDLGSLGIPANLAEWAGAAC